MSETQSTGEMTETQRLQRLQESLKATKPKEEKKTMPKKAPPKKRVKVPEGEPGETGMKKRQRKAAEAKPKRKATRNPRALKPLLDKEKELVAKLAAVRVLIKELRIVLRS
jgi:hypothetical protein